MKFDESLWDFDAVCLYPSAMWDKNSIYPRVESGYACTRDINDGLLEKLNTGDFTQRSAILKKNILIQKIQSFNISLLK